MRRAPLWRHVLVLAALAFLAWTARDLLRVPTGTSLPAVDFVWVLVAVVVAPVAVLAYGEMHRRLLRAARSDLPVRTVQAVTIAGNAISLTLPAAGSASAVVWTGQALVRRGVPAAAATVAVAATGAMSTVALACLVPVLLVAGGVLALPAGVAVTALLVAGAVAAGAAARSAHLLEAALGYGLRALARVPVAAVRRVTGEDPTGTARAWAAGLHPLVPGPRAGAVLALCAMAVYVPDALALVAATRSVLPVVPWQAVSLGWAAGQVGMALQLTPGGVGLVEAGLAGTLLAAGVTGPQVAVVVAVYRGANWLLPALAGWAVYLLLGTSRTGPPTRTGPSRDLPPPGR